MWTYHQQTGKLEYCGPLIGVGYSGAPPLGKNNPAMQDTRDVGPIPRGLYTIGERQDHPRLGDCFALTPDPGNQMFGRSAFFIHGDSAAHPGAASEGCIVMARTVRDAIASSVGKRLTVVV